jgi:DNA-binding transcriptional MerR regulator
MNEGLRSNPAPGPDPDRSARPVYSIGAVARMLGIETTTLRAWEERYGIVVPARSGGGQRLYSRDQIEQLGFVLRRMEDGATAADAHRLLADQLDVAPDPHDGRAQVLVLVVDRDRFAAELCEDFVRREGHDVFVAATNVDARRAFDALRPNLLVIELLMPGGFDLCRDLARHGTAPVLALSTLAISEDAQAADSSGFLQKPLDYLLFVATVRELLGSSVRVPDAAFA